MRKTTAFLTAFTVTLLVVLSIVPSLNIVTDLSRVFHRDYFYLYKERLENTGFLKVAYLIHHKEEYDSLIFGSSRVRFGFNAVTLQQKLGGKWFKLWYPGGVPYQHYHNLRALIENGYIPRQIIIALNDFDMWTQGSDAEFNRNYNRRQYPVGLFDWLGFYRFYLFREPGKTEVDILRGRLPLKRTQRITGEIHGFSAAKATAEKRRRASLRAREPFHGHMADTRYDFRESLGYIAQITGLCRDNGIRLIFVNLPSPLKNLAARNFGSIAEYQKEFVRVSDFYDFSGAYALVNNPLYWFELNHFGRDLGDRMISVLAGPPGTAGQFGAYVTAENIDQHLKAVRDGVKEALTGILRDESNGIISESLLGEKTSILGDTQKYIKKVSGGKWHPDEDGAHLSVESKKSSFILCLPSAEQDQGNVVVRVDLKSAVAARLQITTDQRTLFSKKLQQGANRIYFAATQADLDKGMCFLFSGEAKEYSFSSFDIFAVQRP